ncbi:MAG TPA: ribosome biogenesis GTPase Der [Bacilli bacterium]|nr:ribosome biogenesis GTPase Der [Bacilli bacterium]HPS18592.1 ribosome biogenesis GTPase Der [Bacilli bacterium]
MPNGVVAIVGSPNVGKSTIFNRMIGERHAIVDDEPGMTRDRLYARCEWLGRSFSVIDTGGIEIQNRPFQEQIRIQTQIAIDEADVIVFVTDSHLGLTADDRLVAKMLYKVKKPVILVVNKIDEGMHISDTQEFYALGLGEPLAVSGAHGIGIGDLLGKIIKFLPEKTEEINAEQVTFCLVGRPNVGKSSIVNALLNEERVIVSDISGTTRDSIDTPFVKDDKNYVVIDTAGLKKRGKIYEAIDKYSAIRALKAIERSEIVLLVIDGHQGIIEQDKHVIEYATELHKAIIIVVNKWDIVDKETNTMSNFTKDIRNEYKFLDYAPVCFVSALKKQRIDTIFKALDLVHQAYYTRVKTSLLNDVIQDAQVMNQTPDFNGGRLKIYYASQVSTAPPTFVLFVNNVNFMHFSYQRYLENRLRDTFNFEGTPINILLRNKK